MGTPNAAYQKGVQGMMDGSIDLDTDTLKWVLVDLADYGKAITGATNATPIVITATAHGYSNGDLVAIVGVGGNTAANGIFKIANIATNTFELTDPTTGANVAGNGAYTSGGVAVNLTVDDNLDDIPAAARVATSAALTSKTVTNGVLDAADSVFAAASGDPSEAMVLFKDTGTASTSRLFLFQGSASGLPITPNGQDINIVHDNGANKIIKFGF